MTNTQNDQARLLGAPRTIVLAISAMLCVLWLVYLLFQTGHIWDESEHAHVAWLMSQGQRPLADFFQHHQPLLWDLLSIYYRVGFSGAGVLIWGRILVALCALASVWALFSLGKGSSSNRLTVAGLASAAAFIVLTLLFPALFISRPETLSTACMLVALAVWERDMKPTGLLCLFAGVLAGAACYASPRFVLFAGFFLLFGTQSVRRWLLLASGGVLFVLLYTLISGFSLENVLFNLKFSSYLQSVADIPAGWPGDSWSLLASALALLMLPMLATLRSEYRLRGALLLGNGLAIFAACHQIAGMFTYVQAYAPFIFSVPIAIAWLLARIKLDSRRLLACIGGGVVLLIAVSNFLGLSIKSPALNLPQIVREKNALAAIVPSGRSVLLFTRQHPITVLDASFYGSPLFDAQDRLCRTIHGLGAPVNFPPCDFLRDLMQSRPYLVDVEIGRAVKYEAVPALEAWISHNYVRKNAVASLAYGSGDDVLVEKRADMPNNSKSLIP